MTPRILLLNRIWQEHPSIKRVTVELLGLVSNSCLQRPGPQPPFEMETETPRGRQELWRWWPHPYGTHTPQVLWTLIQMLLLLWTQAAFIQNRFCSTLQVMASMCLNWFMQLTTVSEHRTLYRHRRTRLHSLSWAPFQDSYNTCTNEQAFLILVWIPEDVCYINLRATYLRP